MGSTATFHGFCQPALAHLCGPQYHLLNGPVIMDQVEVESDFLKLEVMVEQDGRCDRDKVPGTWDYS